MARFSDIVTAFLAGEITPKAYGRTELALYKQACEEITNFIVYPQGGAGRRPGSQFLASQISNDFVGSTFINFSTNGGRIVPFIISATEYYLIIFTDSATIHYYNLVTGASGKVASANDEFLASGAFQAALAAAPAAYTAAELPEIQVVQTGNTMAVVHPNHAPFFINYGSGSNGHLFTQVPLGFAGSGPGDFFVDWSASFGDKIASRMPFRDLNISAITLAINTATVGIGRTLTASTAFFNANHVGAFFAVTDAGLTGTGLCFVTGFTDSTHVTVIVFKAFTNTTATVVWTESSWSTYRGWPRTVALFEGRLYYGGSLSQPDTFWASQIGDLFELSAPSVFPGGSPAALVNSDAYDFTLNTDKAYLVQWMAPGKTLAIGTLGREHIGQGSNGAMGPLDLGISEETSYGSSYVQAVRVDNEPIFIQKSALKVRNMVFNFQEDAFNSQDISLFSEHVPKKSMVDHVAAANPKIVGIAHQESDNQVTWMIDNNGGLFAFTRNKEEKVLAWHNHKLGGRWASSFLVPSVLPYDVPKVLSICVAPSVDGTHDDLYLLVQRTINTATVVYLERIGREFQLATLYNPSTAIGDKPVYSDSCKLVILGSPGVTFTGFSHLEGETVSVVADGNYVGTFVVSSGTITLSANAAEVLAGLTYTSVLTPTNIDVGSVAGSAQGRLKKVDEVNIRFTRTVGAKFGKDKNTLDSIPFRDPSLSVSVPIPLFDGDKTLIPLANVQRRVSVTVVQDLPLPCAVTAIIYRGVTYDG